MPDPVAPDVPTALSRIATYLGTLDYLLRGAIDLLRLSGQTPAADTLEQYRKEARDAFDRGV